MICQCVCRSVPSLSRQQLHLAQVTAACELLGSAASNGGQAGSREAALQLLPAIALAGRGTPAATMSQAMARHGRSLDAFQALQRSQQAVCWVGVLGPCCGVVVLHPNRPCQCPAGFGGRRQGMHCAGWGFMCLGTTFKAWVVLCTWVGLRGG